MRPEQVDVRFCVTTEWCKSMGMCRGGFGKHHGPVNAAAVNSGFETTCRNRVSNDPFYDRAKTNSFKGLGTCSNL